jgi:predicted membrane-bound mannosyltransferase
MKQKNITIEHIIYVFIFALAGGIRFVNLGVAPLSEYEARWAFQAWNIAQGNPGVFDIGPLYSLFNGLLFFIFGNSNFIARFFPALVGSFMALIPILFRPALGKRVALLLSFGLAIDPGLVAISRMAGGAALALGFAFLH